jgi:hypothetical protein
LSGELIISAIDAFAQVPEIRPTENELVLKGLTQVLKETAVIPIETLVFDNSKVRVTLQLSYARL